MSPTILRSICMCHAYRRPTDGESVKSSLSFLSSLQLHQLVWLIEIQRAAAY